MTTTGTESRSYSHRGTQWITELKDRDHPAFTFGSQMELAEAITAFIDRGLNQNAINVLLVTKQQGEIYTGYLKEAGIDADSLLSSQDIIIEPIDGLLPQKVEEITKAVASKLKDIGELAKSKGRRGLNIVGEIAGTFAAQGRYEDCALVELFWHSFIPKFNPQITLICPYESIPSVLRRPLEELHNSVIPVEAIWEITPANFDCAKCGVHVRKEIREYEPALMDSQSEVITMAMRESNAGWIPFCFNCISTLTILKPSWLRL